MSHLEDTLTFHEVDVERREALLSKLLEALAAARVSASPSVADQDEADLNALLASPTA